MTVDETGNPFLERGPQEECRATWWHQATPGTTYWRCLVPARRLPGQTIPFTSADLAEVDGKPVIPRHRGDTAIWQFLGDEGRTKVALWNKNHNGIRTLMEIDDDYTRMPPYLKNRRINTPWKETRAEAAGGYSYEMHKLVCPATDGLIFSTDYLADRYYDLGLNDNIYVCPNSVDPDDWQYERPEPDGIFRIVYYGSTSHNSDTPIVTKAMKWASKQPDVEIWTLGFKPQGWSFPYQFIPWSVDLEQPRKELVRFDLGIAPLKPTPWANGKSDVKALEYAMSGVLPLMSDVDPYASWRTHAPDLVLRDNDWEEAIRYFVKNPDLVVKRADEIKDMVLETRTIDKTIHFWEEALRA